MKDRETNKSYRKVAAVAAALLVSGAGAGVFGMAASAAAAAQLGSVQKVPTSYPAVEASAQKAPKGETSLRYHVMESGLNREMPTGAVLPMEEAAAVGMKYLEDIFGFEKDGANVYMSYDSGTITFPRAFWSGSVRFGKEEPTDDDTWSFFIDAVTGELFNLGCTETLKADVPLGYDASLEKNYEVYAKLAKEVAERCKLVDGKVENVAYGSQGYGGNNPDITMEVYGENGQMALLSFSRYNQRLLGILTDTSRVITDKALEDLMNRDMAETIILP